MLLLPRVLFRQHLVLGISCNLWTKREFFTETHGLQITPLGGSMQQSALQIELQIGCDDP